MRLNKTLLAKLIFALEGKINAHRKVGRKYDFYQLKQEVLGAYKKDLGELRDLYSKEVSSHFGKIGGPLGAKVAQEHRLAKRLTNFQIHEAAGLELMEKVRVGTILFIDGELILTLDELNPEQD